MKNIVKNFDFQGVAGEITITKYTGNDTEVIIPPEIDGMPVTSIGKSAFHNCSSLTSVTLPTV